MKRLYSFIVEYYYTQFAGVVSSDSKEAAEIKVVNYIKAYHRYVPAASVSIFWGGSGYGRPLHCYCRGRCRRLERRLPCRVKEVEIDSIIVEELNAENLGVVELLSRDLCV